jgi:hypothetical protein
VRYGGPSVCRISADAAFAVTGDPATGARDHNPENRSKHAHKRLDRRPADAMTMIYPEARARQ